MINQQIWNEIKWMISPFNCRMITERTGLRFDTVRQEVTNLIRLGLIKDSKNLPFFYEVINPERPINIDPQQQA